MTAMNNLCRSIHFNNIIFKKLSVINSEAQNVDVFVIFDTLTVCSVQSVGSPYQASHS